jgi:hypothetical protein
MEERSDYQRVAYWSPSQPFSMAETRKTTKVTRQPQRKKVVVTKTKAPKIGSAAADWSLAGGHYFPPAVVDLVSYIESTITAGL